ncbi:MAG: zinc-dependent peptidase [Pirellulales bacterium]|nr:zinc-dependent peptidase [Pirellulales bacterium]
MFLNLFKSRRRKQLLTEPFPTEWEAWLAEIRHYRQIDDGQRKKLREIARVFVAEKVWEGCDGLEVTEKMKVTIAAGAALLAVGVEPNYYFDRVQTILIFPDTFVRPSEWHGGMLVDEDGVPTLGEAWHRGPIVLAWETVEAEAAGHSQGHNLVAHEFAHYLDGLDGEMDGTPPLAGSEQYANWHRVTQREFERLVHQSQRGAATLLDHYGATNNAEFFAVATECFFERPRELRKRHGELYEALAGFYHQQPAEWPDG